MTNISTVFKFVVFLDTGKRQVLMGLRFLPMLVWYYLFFYIYHYEDFHFLILVGYGYLTVIFLFLDHLGLYTMQEPSYLGEIVLIYKISQPLTYLPFRY